MEFRERNAKNVDLLFSYIKPFLKHGSIILTSIFHHTTSLISPTPIKHSSFCYIENNNYFILEISNRKKLSKIDIKHFLKNIDCIYIFKYHDENIMKKTMDYVFDYKDLNYGFFGNTEYCFKLIFDVYRDVYKNLYNILYKKMSDFFPVFSIFGLEFVNSNSILKSKKFMVSCCVINNVFIEFKN